jgi:hypothetical protein
VLWKTLYTWFTAQTMDIITLGFISLRENHQYAQSMDFYWRLLDLVFTSHRVYCFPLLCLNESFSRFFFYKIRRIKLFFHTHNFLIYLSIFIEQHNIYLISFYVILGIYFGLYINILSSLQRRKHILLYYTLCERKIYNYSGIRKYEND